MWREKEEWKLTVKGVSEEVKECSGHSTINKVLIEGCFISFGALS